MDRELVSTSKFLSFILRHEPEAIGVRLDSEGWVDIDELLDAAKRSGRGLTSALLQRVVRENDKQRFAISADGKRIRASQGHSLPVDLGLAPLEPPERLYHGTVARFLAGIQQHGLLAGDRQYVHLSPDVATARKVGRRRGRPGVLLVRAQRMYEDGFQFFCSDNGVWLTESVPAKYLHFRGS